LLLQRGVITPIPEEKTELLLEARHLNGNLTAAQPADPGPPARVQERRRIMMLLATKLSKPFRPLHPLLFVLGILALIGTWFVLYLTESLFAESHLAAYYCCLMPDALSQLPAWEQALSNFFNSWPGQTLVAGVFIGLNAVVFLRALQKAHRSNRVWLPLLFVLLNILYVGVAFTVVSLSWSISDWVVGPRLSAYKGYHRTWYGIVLHFALWVDFYRLLLKASLAADAARPSPPGTGRQSSHPAAG
jgi:hypothetical protein